MEQYKHVLTGDAVPTAKRRVRRFLLGYLWLSLDAFCKKAGDTSFGQSNFHAHIAVCCI